MFRGKNCQFSFQCFKSWHELASTSDSSVRFCDECKSNVQLCLNQQDFDAAIEKGLCVAAPQEDDGRDEVSLTVGIPKSPY